MNFFDKKFLVILIILIIVFCISIYFFTQEDYSEFIPTNELYVSSTVNDDDDKTQEIIVHIDGEIINPGLVYLPENSRIADAISLAGGVTEFANISQINLAYELKDGQKIYIPSIYDEEEIPYIQNAAGNNVLPEESSSENSLVNINSATQEELETLPGIGTSTAKKIIDYRTKNGDFKKIDDIMNVSGIGEAKFNNIKDYICI